MTTEKHRDLGRVRIEPPAQIFARARAWWPWLWRSFARDLGLRGFGDLVYHLWTDFRFDRRHGVRTNYLVAIEDLDFPDAGAQSTSARYRASPAFSVATSLQRLSERLGGLQDQVLIDYGCGAGRILIVAAEAGVSRTIGIELSPQLVAQCQQNADSYSAAHLGGRCI